MPAALDKSDPATPVGVAAAGRPSCRAPTATNGSRAEAHAYVSRARRRRASRLHGSSSTDLGGAATGIERGGGRGGGGESARGGGGGGGGGSDGIGGRVGRGSGGGGRGGRGMMSSMPRSKHTAFSRSCAARVISRLSWRKSLLEMRLEMGLWSSRCAPGYTPGGGCESRSRTVSADTPHPAA